MRPRKEISLCKVLSYKLKERDWCLLAVLLFVCTFLTYFRSMESGLGESYSFIEVFMMGMGTNINLIFLHSGIFILVISRILCFGEADMQFIIRQKNRSSLFRSNVSGILGMTWLWIFGNLAVSILQSLNGNGLEVTGLYFQEYLGAIRNTDSIWMAYIYLGKFLVNLFFYFISIALLYYVLLLLWKSRFTAVFLVLLGLILNYVCYLCRLQQFYRILPISRISLEFQENGSWIENMGYWCLLLGILICLGHWLAKREDMIRRKRT